MLSKRTLAPIVFGAMVLVSCRDRDDLLLDDPPWRVRSVTVPCDTKEPSIDAGTVDTGTSPGDDGADTGAIEVDDYQVDVWRADDTIDTYTPQDGPVWLAAGNRARIALTIRNHSDGWVPLNFELCIQNAEHLLGFDPVDTDLDNLSIGVTVDEPCVIRFDEWPSLAQDAEQTFVVGAVKALDQPGGNYLAVHVFTEFTHLNEVERIALKIPYRIVP